MGAEGKNPEDAEYPRRHSETQRHDLGLPSVLRTGSEATQGRPVGRPIIKPKLEPTTEPAQVTKIDPVQRPKVVDLEGMTPLSRMSRVREATEQRISNLKKAHADEIASLKAELLRAKRAQKEEQQAHQVTKQRLAETNNEVDRLRAIPVEDSAKAFEIIETGKIDLVKASATIWKILIETYKEIDIGMTGEVIERCHEAVATLGLNMPDDQLRKIVDDILNEGFADELEETPQEGDRPTHVGHKPPRKK